MFHFRELIGKILKFQFTQIYIKQYLLNLIFVYFRIHKVFNEYLLDYSTDFKWENELTVTNEDARIITDEQGFNKVYTQFDK